MARYLELILVVLFGAVCTTACRIELLQSPTAGSAAPAVIATSTDAAKAASQVMQTAELVAASADLFKNIGDHTIHVMNTDPTVTLTAPVPCADYGEYTYKGTVDGSGNFSLELTYALCREQGFQLDGVVTATGTATDLSAKLGGSTYLRLIDFDSASYKAITGILTLTGLSFKMTSPAGANSGMYVIKPSGNMTAFDYVTLGSYTVSFGSNIQYNYSLSAGMAGTTVNVIADGGMRQAWTGGSASMAMTTFAVTRLLQGAAGNYTSGDLSVSGTAQYDFGSPTTGVEGVLTISTSVPVHTLYNSGATTDGTVTLSGSGTATLQYKANGSIDVAAGGLAAVSFAGQYSLYAVVGLYGFEQVTPTLMGVTGTASPLKATGSIWNATMTVTALSSGTDLNCFTDVHVNYYAPSDLTTVAWYVDWHIDLVNGCTKPAGIPFEEARDVNGNGTCDAGLDINGAEVDKTSGGVEHFTATDLPEGYYVVSINNWGCGTDVTNQATIIIGDYLFGTYNCTYTTSDGEASDPGAWCRLADIRVNANGTADVLAPDAAYNPWHD